ncbi:hypothetical protein [Paenibacillus sp. L3-i20]|uniref:hypothetical protein n=1 Tax=Paenibacillus sp. L3-i20 TaxID=2905833 RepID=UPI001EE0517C|nr:hypothetical protein [Paenibacillus sp. L3-i20]GKU80313.1 hypothetical protein L3i20_v247100 [Paenibacillus sp. L3-i20]
MFCPICNGIESYQGYCISCGDNEADCGRISDWTGPYAPYEQIMEGHLNQREAMESEDSCCHIIYCSKCQSSREVFISTWHCYLNTLT